jgi:tetratricopeptide (TPR) repeat protein
MKSVSAALFCFVLMISVPAQGPTDWYAQIKRDTEDRKYVSAISSLRSLEGADKESFRSNNFDYLLARLLLRTGDSGQAAKYFQTVRARGSILREYATWHLAAMARSSGNLVGERMFLTELMTDRPDSLLYDAANRRIIESNFESRNYEAVILSLSRGESASGSGTVSRESQLTLARAHLFKGDADAARPIFDGIIASSPNPAQPDDFALHAVRSIDSMEVGSDRFGKEVAKLGDYEHLKRASIYQFNRDFALARLHFLAILNDHPESGLAPDAVYQIGRGYTQMAEYTEAVKWYERVAEQFPVHPVNRDALLQLASAYSRLAKYREAVARYEKFIQSYPGDERLDRAYLNIVDVLRDAGEETEALNRADKIAEMFKGRAGEAQAIFAKARMRIARSDWANALIETERLRGLKELGGVGLPGGTTPAEIGFLHGLVLDQLKRFPDAIESYLSISYGRNEYYGWLAADRTRSMGAAPETKNFVVEKRASVSNEAAALNGDARRTKLQKLLRLEGDADVRTKYLEELKKLYASLSSYKPPPLPKSTYEVRKVRTARSTQPRRDHSSIAEELIFLGLYDEAAPEFEASLRGVMPNGKRLSSEMERTIATLYLKGDRADRAAVFISPYAKLPSDLEPELLPDDIAGMLYPAPYKDALLQHAPPRGVDPRLVLAIMRQESGFRPNVKSVAAARGLMQFISDTSDRIAAELGRENFEQNELYYPPTAILFGSQYLSDLFKIFPGQPEAVAASYNGGEDNMRRWYGRANSELPGRYVPEIGFAQSKDYVWRVMANYRMYQLLYDERLERK